MTMTENKDESSLPQEEVQEEGEPWQELMGSELVMKKLIRMPEAASVQPQDAVVVDFVGYAAESVTSSDDDDDSISIFHSAQDWLVVVGEKDVVPALELCIRFMNVGETALVWSHTKYAYGPSQRTNGDYTLPAHSHVKYRVTVKSIIESDQRDEPDFLLRYSSAKKDIGNDVFIHEWDLHQGKAKAIQLYSKGANNLQLLIERANELENTEMVQQASSLMIDCLNNIVAVHLRAKDYHAAKQAAVKVLSVDPDNTKALLRAAKAALLDPASSYEEVKAALDAAASSSSSSSAAGDGDDKELRNLRAQFHQQKQTYKQRSKDFASKMMTPNKTLSTSIAPSNDVSATQAATTTGTSQTNEGESLRDIPPVAAAANEVPTTSATHQADQDEPPTNPDWDLKTLFMFMIKQLLIVSFVLAYTKWGKMGQLPKQGNKGLDTDEL